LKTTTSRSDMGAFQPLKSKEGFDVLVDRIYTAIDEVGPMTCSDMRQRFEKPIAQVMEAAEVLVRKGWVTRKLIWSHQDLYRYVYSIARTKRAA